MKKNPRDVRAGDIGETRTARLTGVDSLSAVDSVVAHLERKGVRETLTASVTDPATSEVTIEMGDADGWLASSPDPGPWRLLLDVTFNDGRRLTWPDDDWATLVVMSDVEAPAP